MDFYIFFTHCEVPTLEFCERINYFFNYFKFIAF